ALDTHRPGEKVDLRKIHVSHILGAVIVPDLAAGPVVAFEDEIIAGLDLHGHRDIRVPAVVHAVVVVRGFVQVDLDQCFRHESSPSALKEKGHTDRKPAMTCSSMAVRSASCTSAPFSITSTRSATSSTKLSTCSETMMD